jgi:adenylate cyclase
VLYVKTMEASPDSVAVPGRCSGRALFRQMAILYLQGSLAAAVVTLLLVLLGLGFTGRQWTILLSSAVPGIATYTLTDIYLIRRHLRPIRRALEKLDAGSEADEDTLGRAMTRSLNLPFLSFLRVTCLHGPLATILLCSVLIGANRWLMTEYATWQIIAFACTVMFFASPTHAIFEYFSVSEKIEPTIKRLSRAMGNATLPPDHQSQLIAIRLKEKLLYLAIFVASLPLLFFAFSMVFKIEQLFRMRGLSVDLADMLPLYTWIGGVVLVCVTGAFAMALLTAREVSRSAARMIEAMHRVESGRLDEAHLDVISTDEYADLFRGFGLMVDSLREEQQILAVSHDLAGELQLEVLIARIMQAAAELLGAERSTLFIHDAKTDELYSVYAAGMETREIRIPANQGIAGAVFTTGRLENIADPYADPRFDPNVDLATGFRTRNILCAPIANKAGGRIGVTQVLNKRGGAFTGKDEARLRAFAAQVAVSLENAKLFDDVLNMKNYNDSILKSISNAVITLDEDDNIVTLNDAAEGLLGKERRALVGTPAEAAFGAENRWLLDSLRQTATTGEAALAVDAELARLDMPPATVNLTATPLVDGADHRLGSIAVIEDITRERRVRATMARYMSQEVADQLLAAGEAELSGKVQEVSVLFSDVRGFTTIAESLGARDTVSLLNEYFSEMVDVIFDNGGILDKYIGDAIMALFGAPFQSPDDADHALAVANQMMVRLGGLNARLRESGKLELDIGIGLSTGDVVVGNIGSARRMEYTVIGDSVNLASRLEGANKQYNTRILLSEFTRAKLKRPALLREVDLVRVKGKERPAAVFESLGYRERELANGLGRMLDLYEQGLAAFRARCWRDAGALFSGALAVKPDDGPSRLYLQRARRYAAKPPPEPWDGVWSLTEK